MLVQSDYLGSTEQSNRSNLQEKFEVSDGDHVDVIYRETSKNWGLCSVSLCCAGFPV